MRLGDDENSGVQVISWKKPSMGLLNPTLMVFEPLSKMSIAGFVACDWEGSRLFAGGHQEEALSAFEIEAKAAFIVRWECSKELFGSNLVLEGDCKELISLLHPMAKMVGCGLPG